MCRCSALPLRRIGTPRQPHATHCHVAFSIGSGTTILAGWQGKDANLDGPYARAGSPRASTLGGDGVHVTPPAPGCSQHLERPNRTVQDHVTLVPPGMVWMGHMHPTTDTTINHLAPLKRRLSQSSGSEAGKRGVKTKRVGKDCRDQACSKAMVRRSGLLATWAWLVHVACQSTWPNVAHGSFEQVMDRPERRTEENITLAVGLDGSAFLSSYYFGVMASLEELGVIQPGHTIVSGSSAGALVALASCLRYPFENAYQILRELARKCQDNWDRTKELLPCQGTLYREIRNTVDRIIGNEPLAYQRCSGKLRTFILALNPKTRGQTRSTHMEISDYKSNEDLADAVGAATFVPCWSACQPYVLFRSMPIIDGAFQMPQGKFCPEGVFECIRVRVNQPGDYTQNPGRPCNFAASQVGSLLENGVRNLGCFRSSRDAPFQKQGLLPQHCPYFPLRVPTVMRNADIYPGKYEENPLATTCYQHQRGLLFPDLENIDALFQQGKMDARIWVSKRND